MKRALILCLLLAGCAHQPAKLQIPVPQSLREPCERPNPESVQTVGDLAAYSIRQDAAIKTCSSPGDALVSLIDAANGVKAKRWWGR